MTRRSCTQPLRVEALEPRHVPSRVLLASWWNPDNAQREIAKFATFSSHAILLSSTPVPANPATGDQLPRDVDVTADGRWAVFNGTSSPSLAVYNPVSRTWKHLSMPGWDLDFNGSYGGLVTAGRYAFAPDMDTFFGNPKGIVRFDLKAMTATRFADTQEYTDLNVGLNGKLYALRGDDGPIDVFDPASMQYETTVTPAAGNTIRGVAANKAGQIFIVDWHQNIYKLSPTGDVLDSIHLDGPEGVTDYPNANAHDIDISTDGTLLVVGSRLGWGVQLSTSFTGVLLYFRGATSDLQVTFLENAPQLPVVPAFRVNDAVVTEGHSGTRLLSFAVRLSAPTTRNVTVNYTTTDDSATAGSDYSATSGTLTFLPGQVVKTIPVTVTGDLDFEPDESFKLILSDPVYGTLGDAEGIGTIRTDDREPIAVAGLDRSIAEGATVAFSAMGSFDPDHDPLTYEWDFGDGSTGTGFTINHQYVDDGSFTATLTARDPSGLEATDDAAIVVANRLPTGAMSGPQATVPGWARPWRFTGADPGVIDRTNLEYRIDWDDGPIQTVHGGTLVTIGHSYATPGTYTVLLRVKDKDGGQSAEYHRNIVVKPLHVEGGTVYVPGTPGDDAIEIRAANATGTSFTVAINSQTVGSWSASGLTIFGREGSDTVTTVGVISRRLIVDGGAGNDTIDVESATGPNVLIGGAGDDVLDGGAGPNVLIGGAGDDVLNGGAGRDVLIGGAGADTLDGGGNDDVLLGAGVAFQTDPLALKTVSAEWARVLLSYEMRRDHLLGDPVSGLNGKNVLAATTIVADAAVDSVTGGDGRDWFFNSTTTLDNLVDQAEDETVTEL